MAEELQDECVRRRSVAEELQEECVRRRSVAEEELQEECVRRRSVAEEERGAHSSSELGTQCVAAWDDWVPRVQAGQETGRREVVVDTQGIGRRREQVDAGNGRNRSTVGRKQVDEGGNRSTWRRPW